MSEEIKKAIPKETGINLLTNADPYIDEKLGKVTIDRICKQIDSYLDQLFASFNSAPVKPVEGETDVKYITAYGLKTKVWCFKGEYGYGCADYGVVFRQDSKNWRAQILYKGSHISLGSWKTEEDAAKARDKGVIERKLDLPLNFPITT